MSESGTLTQEQVRHVAKLARLQLDEKDLDQLANDLSNILKYISKLEELDVTHVQPMAHPIEMANVLREDQPVAGLSTQAVLENAPEKDAPFFKVPKVLGDSTSA